MNKIARLFPLFSVAFVIIYVPVLYWNLALFTYHPQPNEWQWLAAPPKAGPAMYWYGVIATSAIAAAVVTLIGSLVPRETTARIWSGLTWAVPVAAMGVIMFILKDYFLK